MNSEMYELRKDIWDLTTALEGIGLELERLANIAWAFAEDKGLDIGAAEAPLDPQASVDFGEGSPMPPSWIND